MLRKLLILAFVAAVGAFCLSGCKKTQPAPTPAPPAPKAAVEQKPAAEPAKMTPAPPAQEAPKAEEPAKAAPEVKPAAPVAQPAPAEPAPVEPNTAK
jgi:type IV secretory pathway VirB10-like protein